MKIELNLDTEEKQALFLLLFNQPASLQDFLVQSLENTHSYKPDWQHKIHAVSQQRGDSLNKLIDSTFSFTDWQKVHKEFHKKGNA